MEILDFSIEPGAVREIHCQGSYVYFYGGSAGGADATIGVKMDARGERVLLMPGQAFRMEPGQKAQRWIISNHAGQSTIMGRLVIGSGQIDDNRVTGSVEVIDGGKNRTLAGLAHAWAGGQLAVAGQYSFAQLFNPAASGKKSYIRALSVTVSGTAVVAIHTNSAPLGALGSVPKSTKNQAANPPVMQARQGTNGEVMTNISVVDYQNIAANVTNRFVLQEPILLMEGQGVVFEVQVPTITMNYSCEWIEE